MSAIVFPTSEAEICDIVTEAGVKNSPLRIIGGGTREGLGRPVKADKTLSLAKHSGITLYEPGALTIVAKAGTPIAQIEQILAGKNQRLAFEPMDHRSLFSTKGKPTIGGIVGGNISGPRRIIGGACRDSLIGVRFINGDGEIIKNGGRVMKNVTGLDLVKLMAGSYGTLGVLSEVSFKVLPANEREATLSIFGLDLQAGISVLSAALGSPFEVTGAAFIPADENPAQTLLRVEGFDTQVSYRLERLKELCAKSIAGSPDIEIIEGEEHNNLWQFVRDISLFQSTDELVLRLHIKPGDAPAITKFIENKMAAKMMFDWGGGLVWVGIPNPENVATIRSIVKDFGGFGMLVRAPAKVREQISPFHPEHDRVAAISECIRKKFDPKGILNPGRMAPLASTPAIEGK